MGYFFSTTPPARSEAELVGDLASSCAEKVCAAAAGLWEFWLNEAGPVGRREIDRGIGAMADGDLKKASRIFRELMDEHPGWAEAINKQATALYLQGLPDESIELCGEVVKLKPDHFGAWNGLALCAVQTEDWLLAREAVLQSLRLQPSSRHNRQLLVLVESRLANC